MSVAFLVTKLIVVSSHRSRCNAGWIANREVQAQDPDWLRAVLVVGPEQVGSADRGLVAEG